MPRNSDRMARALAAQDLEREEQPSGAHSLSPSRGADQRGSRYSGSNDISTIAAQLDAASPAPRAVSGGAGATPAGIHDTDNNEDGNFFHRVINGVPLASGGATDAWKKEKHRAGDGGHRRRRRDGRDAGPTPPLSSRSHVDVARSKAEAAVRDAYGIRRLTSGATDHQRRGGDEAKIDIYKTARSSSLSIATTAGWGSRKAEERSNHGAAIGRHSMYAARPVAAAAPPAPANAGDPRTPPPTPPQRQVSRGSSTDAGSTGFRSPMMSQSIRRADSLGQQQQQQPREQQREQPPAISLPSAVPVTRGSSGTLPSASPGAQRPSTFPSPGRQLQQQRLDRSGSGLLLSKRSASFDRLLSGTKGSAGGGARVGRGFINAGNTCYVAATVQLLFRCAFGRDIAHFSKLFSQHRKQVELDITIEETRTIVDDESWGVTNGTGLGDRTETADLIVDVVLPAQPPPAAATPERRPSTLQRRSSTVKVPVVRREVHEVDVAPLHTTLSDLRAYICSRPVEHVTTGHSLAALRPHFRDRGFFDGEQHDAHEFLVAMIDILEKEATDGLQLTREKCVEEAESANGSGVVAGGQQSWVHQLLSAVTCTEVRCTHDWSRCRHQVVTMEPCAIVGVPLPRTKGRLLRNRCKPVEVERDALTLGAAAPSEAPSCDSVRQGGDTDGRAPPVQQVPPRAAGTREDLHVLRDLVDRAQHVSRAHAYRCDCCGFADRTVHKTRFLRCPEVLLVHLKRFDMRFKKGRVVIKKNTSVVHHSEVITLTQYRDQPAGCARAAAASSATDAPHSREDPAGGTTETVGMLKEGGGREVHQYRRFVPVARHEYQLAGFVEHRGASLFSGHYVCFFRADEEDQGGNPPAPQKPQQSGAAQEGFSYERCFRSPAGLPWFIADDERLTKASPTALESRVAAGGESYILAYVRTQITPIAEVSDDGHDDEAEIRAEPLSESDDDRDAAEESDGGIAPSNAAGAGHLSEHSTDTAAALLDMDDLDDPHGGGAGAAALATAAAGKTALDSLPRSAARREEVHSHLLESGAVADFRENSYSPGGREGCEDLGSADASTPTGQVSSAASSTQGESEWRQLREVRGRDDGMHGEGALAESSRTPSPDANDVHEWMGLRAGMLPLGSSSNNSNNNNSAVHEWVTGAEEQHHGWRIRASKLAKERAAAAAAAASSRSKAPQFVSSSDADDDDEYMKELELAE